MNPHFFKRPFSALIVLLTLIPFLHSTNATDRPLRQAQDRPNIIFILADDLGYSDIEPFGQKMIKTPHLNRMAKEGIRFTNHYAGGPVCAPSRSVLMTGQHTGRTPVRGNKRDIDEGVQPLSHNVMTIAEMLKRETDYTTALYGRWHLGGIFSDSMPHQRGFDEFFGALSKYYKPLDTYYRPDLYQNGELYLIEGNNNGSREVHREDLITEKALDFVSRQKGKDPFFLYMAYSFAHAPVQAVPGENRYNDQPWPQKEIDFAHNISRLDKFVGQFMDHLKKLGMAENTLVIFTSDNGPHMEDGHDADFFDSNGPFQGYKRDLYEGGIRMPFIAWWPSIIKAGTESNHVSAFWDLMPTVADVAGIEPPAQTTGISYLPTLLGNKQPKHEYLYWEFKERTPRQAIRMEKWKGQYFIEHDRFELYDLNKDPGEEKDLADKHPDMVATMQAKMAEAHTYNRHFPITNAEKYIQVSPRDRRYLQYEDGTPYIPIGPNIPWSRTTTDSEKLLKQYEHYFSKLAANGGNFTRIWLSAPHWEIENKQVFAYDYAKMESVLNGLVEIATRHGIKLKFCFENFRQLLNRPAPFEGSVAFDKPFYHLDNGGPIRDMNEYVNSEVGRELFIEKMRFFSNQYGANPTIFGWELWNEMNSIRTSNKPYDIYDWTQVMLKEARKVFPRHMVMQSLGSFDTNSKREFYRSFSLMEGNEIAQIHRYLDPGEGKLAVVQAPMDILAADAARELLSYGLNKPAIVSEVGAVEANHAGPSKLYEVDSEGVLLHDLVFAPFFAGAAAPGQSWHWHHYIDKHDLWWHFGRFSEAINGINPLRENFEPLYSENAHTRNYTLKGSQTTLVWLRDVNSPWQSELEEGNPAQPIKNLKVDLLRLGFSPEAKSVQCYLPWEDRWTTVKVRNNTITLPDFKRSILLKAEE